MSHGPQCLGLLARLEMLDLSLFQLLRDLCVSLRFVADARFTCCDLSLPSIELFAPLLLICTELVQVFGQARLLSIEICLILSELRLTVSQCRLSFGHSSFA